MHFDLIDVKLFVNIAEEHSVTRAAEISHISAPAASKRVTNLEDRLGAHLLYRNAHGVTLTPAGQVFVNHARLILHQVEQLLGGLQQYAHGMTGEVRVFANTTAINDFLPGVVRRFLVAHPNVNVDLREGGSRDIVHAVLQGTTDIGIGYMLGDLCTDGLQVLPYRQDRLVLAVSVGHALCRKKAVRFDETLALSYVGLAETSPMQIFLNQVASNFHQPLKIRTRVTNFEELCHMVEVGVGIGILPKSAVRKHGSTMAIQIIPLTDKWSEQDLQVFVRNLKELPVFARELVDFLLEDSPPGVD